MRIRAGDSFAGYSILSKLGRGGMATVYLARENELGRRVALKVLPDSLIDDADFSARFELEARVIASLDHPHIVPLYRHGIHEDAPWMALRFVDGGDLAARLHERPLPLAEGLRIFRGIAAALEYAHGQGIVHRDFKPHNVLLTSTGLPYLADFGVAKLLEGSSILRTQTGGVFGTPAYMAPEQAMGGVLGPATDVYALAVTAFQWLAGKLPFDADTPHAVLMKHISEPLPLEMLHDLPAAATRALARALSKASAARYSSAPEFIADLEAGLQPGDWRLPPPAAGPSPSQTTVSAERQTVAPGNVVTTINDAAATSAPAATAPTTAFDATPSEAVASLATAATDAAMQTGADAGGAGAPPVDSPDRSRGWSDNARAGLKLGIAIVAALGVAAALRWVVVPKSWENRVVGRYVGLYRGQRFALEVGTDGSRHGKGIWETGQPFVNTLDWMVVDSNPVTGIDPVNVSGSLFFYGWHKPDGTQADDKSEMFYYTLDGDEFQEMEGSLWGSYFLMRKDASSALATAFAPAAQQAPPDLIDRPLISACLVNGEPIRLRLRPDGTGTVEHPGPSTLRWAANHAWGSNELRILISGEQISAKGYMSGESFEWTADGLSADDRCQRSKLIEPGGANPP